MSTPAIWCRVVRSRDFNIRIVGSDSDFKNTNYRAQHRLNRVLRAYIKYFIHEMAKKLCLLFNTRKSTILTYCCDPEIPELRCRQSWDSGLAKKPESRDCNPYL